MFRLLTFSMLIAAATSFIEERSSIPRLLFSAASPGQISFAVENKYDDTGPGAKMPEYAYRGYKNLDEALVAYLEDPDTKLPDHERARAIKSLYRGSQKGSVSDRYLTGHKQKSVPLVLLTYDKYFKEPGMPRPDYRPNNSEFRWQKMQSVKANPLNIAHYTRHDEEYEPYKNNPRYWYSDDGQNPQTGHIKSAVQSDGDLVLGYYTFKDADGAQRTVRYEPGDKFGFRNAVRRVFNVS